MGARSRHDGHMTNSDQYLKNKETRETETERHS